MLPADILTHFTIVKVDSDSQRIAIYRVTRYWTDNPYKHTLTFFIDVAIWLRIVFL